MDLLQRLIMAGSPAAAGGGSYVGIEPDIGIPCSDGSGTAVAVELPGSVSDQTGDADEWLTSPTRYNCNSAQGILSAAGDFNSVLDSLTDQLTIFARCSHPSSWNFTQRTICSYGPNSGGNGPRAFSFLVDRNHTAGQYRMLLYYQIASTASSVNALVDYGDSAQSGEHSLAMVYDGTDVQFYFDGSTHGSAQSLTGDFDLPATAGKVLGVGCQITGGLASANYWTGGIRDVRMELAALTAGEISTWHANAFP